MCNKNFFESSLLQVGRKNPLSFEAADCSAQRDFQGGNVAEPRFPLENPLRGIWAVANFSPPYGGVGGGRILLPRIS
jgi:hypothetical protein